MSSQATNNDRSRTYWTPPMERYFIDLMLDQVRKGNRTGHTFTKQAWTDMLAMFNGKFGSKYDKDVLKGRYKNLWEQYNAVKILLEQSDFAWDETRQMVIAADYDWDIYIKTHPDVRPYKTKPVMNYNDLCVIYGYTTADGRYSFSSHDVDHEDEISAVKNGDGLITPNPTGIDRSRTNWTPTMDRFFVDLMLDQVNKGNKIAQTFNKKAWNEMIQLFNEKFDSKYNKNVLRSRYKILRKHYSDMKLLLSESGFALDDSRQTVVADDCAWDDYIKVHPDTRSCRTTTVPDFNDLYMIYGNEISDGRRIRTIHDVNLSDDIIVTDSGKDSQTNASYDRSRTYWTPPMDRYLIDLMLEQMRKGNKVENTFIAQAWTTMTTLFNSKFGSRHDKDVLKNRYKSLRKQQNDIKVLLDQSGFAWDETRKMVRADDSVWDAYIKAHPDARPYRIKIVPHYNELCMICGNTVANGGYSHSDYGLNQDFDIMGLRIGDELGNQGPLSCDSLTIYWTPQMDQYFIDLMLDQVHKGNRREGTFTREAWGNMATMVNEQFGLQLDEVFLRTQYEKLWKEYKDIKTLLEQGGFSWDDTQQMVYADDDVWHSYIEAHPSAQTYRTMRIPHYGSLCMIYGVAPTDGRNSLSGDEANLNYDVLRFMVGEEMDNQVSTIYDSARTYWTPPMDRYFIELMLDQVHKGNKIDFTFTKQAWLDMITLFNAKFGFQHEKDVLRSRYKNLRKQYNDIKFLLDQSGFSWDESRQMVTADDGAWDACLKVHPDARSYRTKTVLDYNSLTQIYGNASANGINCHSGDNAESSDNNATEKSDGRSCEVPFSSERSRTFWTLSMDRYFIDLMLEQVHGGNKIDHTFNKKAWAHMITLFNAKYESQYDKEVLKSRHKNLRRQYNFIANLLNQSGFSWDERRQMVTADDATWDSYLKAHPDAQSYRTKILANYADMCVIYGDGISIERKSQLDHGADMDSDVKAMTTSGVSGVEPFQVMDATQRDPSDSLVSTPHLNKDAILSNKYKRCQSSRLLGSQPSKKVQKRAETGMVDAISEMRAVVTSLADSKEEIVNSISIENWMNALQSIPDIDEDLLLDACDLLEDENRAKTFLALDAKLRKKWLTRKLR